jgi:transcriptional regulator with XRE-family HTH domain
MFIPSKRPTDKMVDALREIRMAWKLRIQDVEAKANLGENCIRRLERGYTANPNIKTLRKWADALGYDIVIRPKNSEF